MRFFLILLAGIVSAFCLSAYVTIFDSPEIKFWHLVDEIRDKEIAQTRRFSPQKPILFFVGGSSCAFSIDPKIIEEQCGLPAFNLGLPVSAGAKYLLHQALEKTSLGDVLVVCLEPDLLTYPDDFKASQLSFALASKRKHPFSARGGSSFGESLEITECLNLLRPGPTYISTWMVKKITGKGYRYQPNDIKYHGRIETAVMDRDIRGISRKEVSSLSPSGRKLLTDFHTAAQSKGVTLLYSMPWTYTTQEAIAHNKSKNNDIENSINSIIPVVKDHHHGVAADREFFSDSVLHLTASGSNARSLAIGETLHTWLKNNRHRVTAPL